MNSVTSPVSDEFWTKRVTRIFFATPFYLQLDEKKICCGGHSLIGVLSFKKHPESLTPVKQDIAMEAANFTLKFDEKNLLEYIEEIVIPAFTLKRTRRY